MGLVERLPITRLPACSLSFREDPPKLFASCAE